MSRLIEVVVSPTGETTVQTKGYPGAECLRAASFLEHVIGDKTADRLTPEYYGNVPTQIRTEE